MAALPKAVLFGASQRGLEVLEHVRDHYVVIGFADNDAKKQGGHIAGIPVYAPSVIMELKPDIVFVSSMYSPEIIHQLVRMGFPPTRIQNADHEYQHRMGSVAPRNRRNDDVAFPKPVDSNSINEIPRRPLSRLSNFIGSALGEFRCLRQTYALMRHDKDWARRNKYAHDLRKRAVDSRLVLLESFFGRGLISSPFALFCAWLDRSDFNEHVFVWVLDDLSKHEKVIKQYSHDCRNVLFVQRGSSEYMRYLATAKYLINDVSFDLDFVKRDGQVYINTWHSITVKTLGYDIPGKALGLTNVIRNFLACDYILAPNAFMRERIFLHTHRLEGLYPGRIIETGHPRDDLTFRTTREEMLSEWRQAGVDVDPAKKIIMYAPTWRGTNLHAPSDRVSDYLDLIRGIRDSVGDEYAVVLRLHQSVYASLEVGNELRRINVPSMIDTNRCFCAVDILITDYSSIYFDYLVTGNPVLFYLTDLEEYNQYRGVYFSPEELPGPVAANPEELVNHIRNIDAIRSEYRGRYDATRDWACPHEDGRVSKRVLDVVLDGASTAGIYDEYEQAGRKLLFYAGDLTDTPATDLLFTILQHIERDAVDITVLIDDKGSAITQRNAERLLELGVRPLGRLSHLVVDALECYCIDSAQRLSRVDRLRRTYIRRAMRTEWRRCFGCATYDHIINLDNDSLFHSYLLLDGSGGKKIICRDSDSQQKQGARSESLIATTYGEYDSVVSGASGVIEALGNDMKRKKVLIFGCGQRGREIYQLISNEYTVLGFVDNDAAKHGTELFGHRVYSPNDILGLDYDLIVVASMYSSEIIEQLNRLGVESCKLLDGKFNAMCLVEHDAVDALRELDRIFRETQTRYWITCGTLLGLHRSGRFIGYDSDIDVCIHKSDLNAKVLHSLLSCGFTFKRALGRLEDGFGITLLRGPVKVGIMVFYPRGNGDGYVSVYSDLQNDSYLKHNYVYRPFDVVERLYEHYNLTLFAPKDADAYLTQQYGADYKVPQTNWLYDSSPPNIEHEGKRVMIRDSLGDYQRLLAASP